jgi:hypothetical protein
MCFSGCTVNVKSNVPLVLTDSPKEILVVSAVRERNRLRRELEQRGGIGIEADGHGRSWRDAVLFHTFEDQLCCAHHPVYRREHAISDSVTLNPDIASEICIDPILHRRDHNMMDDLASLH